jgi:hypothetical protein
MYTKELEIFAALERVTFRVEVGSYRVETEISPEVAKTLQNLWK